MPTVALSVPAIARVHRPRPRTTARGRAPIRVARASAAGAPDEASAGGGASSSESDALRKCAIAFVDRHVSSGDRVGIGAGPMVSLVLGEIHDRLADSRLDDVQAVPTGTLTAKEAAVAGVPPALASSRIAAARWSVAGEPLRGRPASSAARRDAACGSCSTIIDSV